MNNIDAILAMEKDDPTLPSTYTLFIKYIGGKTEELEVGEHRLIEFIQNPATGQIEQRQNPFYEIITADDEIVYVPFNLAVVKGDKRWTKITEHRKKKAKELQEKKQKELNNE